MRRLTIKLGNEFFDMTTNVDEFSTLAQRALSVADGKVEPYDGDMEDYRRLILQGPEAVQKARDKAAAEEAARVLALSTHGLSASDMPVR